jgi:hypothetical protein
MHRLKEEVDIKTTHSKFVLEILHVNLNEDKLHENRNKKLFVTIHCKLSALEFNKKVHFKGRYLKNENGDPNFFSLKTSQVKKILLNSFNFAYMSI